MPWTFAHPAAVLPLRRLCPRWLSWPGLILGAMAPDLSYYVGLHGPLRAFCHTPEGILAVCLPASLAMLAALLRFAKPLTVLLPEPLRRLARAELKPPPQGVALGFVIAVLSILIGAATHVGWDFLTHGDGLSGELLPGVDLSANPQLASADLLQHLSSALGAAVLTVAYGLARRRQPPVPRSPLDRQRAVLAWCAFGAALLVGALSAWALTPDTLPGYASRRIVRTVVWSTSCFATLFVIASVAWWRRRGDA